MALDVASLKVAELKDELKKRDLPVSGKKAELAERLQAAIDADGGATGDEQAPAAAEDAPAAEAEPAPTSEQDGDLSKLKVTELKAELKELGLPVSGKKDELIERLAEAKAQAAEGAADEEAAPEEPAEAAAEEAEEPSAAELEPIQVVEAPQEPVLEPAPQPEVESVIAQPELPSEPAPQPVESVPEPPAAPVETAPEPPIQPRGLGPSLVLSSSGAPVATEQGAPITTDAVLPSSETTSTKRKRDDEDDAMDVEDDEPIPPEPEQGNGPQPPANDPVTKRARLDDGPSTSAAPPPSEPAAFATAPSFGQPAPPPPIERIYQPPPVAAPAPPRSIAPLAQAYILETGGSLSDVRASLIDIDRQLTTGKGVAIDLLKAQLTIELRVPQDSLSIIAFPSSSTWDHLGTAFVGFASSVSDEPNEIATKLASSPVNGPVAITRYIPASSNSPAERNARNISIEDLAQSIATWASLEQAGRSKLLDEQSERLRLSMTIPGDSQAGRVERVESELRSLLR